MVGPQRVEYEGACYHVMNRGQERGAIYHGDRYYDSFLQCLEQAHRRFAFIDVICQDLTPNIFSSDAMTVSSVIFSFGVFAIILMIAAGICSLVYGKIATRLFYRIRAEDSVLYRELLGTNKISFVERKVRAFEDIPVQLSLQKKISNRDDRIVKLIGLSEVEKYIFYKKITYYLAIISVTMLLGMFILASHLISIDHPWVHPR